MIFNIFTRKIEFFPPTVLPRPEEHRPRFSEGVFFMDDQNQIGTAYYDYKKNNWVFEVPTDFIRPYPEEDRYNPEIHPKINWRWFYPPVTKDDMVWQNQRT